MHLTKEGVFMKKVVSRFLVVLGLLVVLSFSVSAANETAQDGFDWLAGDAKNGSYDNDVGESSLALLALSSIGAETSLIENWLLSQYDSDKFCWPDGGCTVQETSLAVLGLNAAQERTTFDDVQSWYTDALQEADVSGKWYMEVVTDDTGTCTVSYELDGETIEVSVDVDGGAFPSCSDSHFLDLNSCLKANLLSTNPGITLDVDCGSLDGDVTLALVYKSSSTYYLVGNENSATGDFTVNNGCFARGATGGSCDILSTLYAQWVLGDVGSSISTLVYLKEKYDSTDPEQVALLYLITKDEQYLQDLADLQKSDGSFDRDVYTTGLAVLALKDSPDYETEVDDATAFLREEQDTDGYWNKDVSATALALYAAFSDEDVTPETCDNAVEDGEEDGVDCGGACDSCTVVVVSECDVDADCEDLYGTGYVCEDDECTLSEETVTCENDDDCGSGEICLDSSCIEGDCNYQGDEASDEADCEYPDYNENVYNCPSDCWCGDGVCDDVEADAGSSSDYYCAEDCGEETATEECTTDDDCASGEICDSGTCVEETVSGGSATVVWIITIIVTLIALGAIGYYGYKKGWFKKGGGKGPVSGVQVGQPYRPFTSRLPQQQRPLGK